MIIGLSHPSRDDCQGASRCGAAARWTILVEWAAVAIPTIAVWFGLHNLFAEKKFAIWITDFNLAFGSGIVFQYFTIAPIRGLGVGEGGRSCRL